MTSSDRPHHLEVAVLCRGDQHHVRKTFRDDFAPPFSPTLSPASTNQRAFRLEHELEGMRIVRGSVASECANVPRPVGFVGFILCSTCTCMTRRAGRESQRETGFFNKYFTIGISH